MKIVACALAGLTLACAAHAQSSITLYGSIDEGITCFQCARRYTRKSRGSMRTATAMRRFRC
jgi:predicted porin